MATYWCEWAWLGGDAASQGVVITVDDGTITSIHSGVVAPPAGARRLDGFTLPGLANAHSHAFHRALRGRTGGAGGSFWTWRDEMYRIAADLDPDTYFRLARAVYGEMALAGITCVGEFHYVHHDRRGRPYADPLAMSEALVAAAADAGLRLTLLDTCYLHGGIDVELNDVQRRFSDVSVDGWLSRHAGAHRLIGDMCRVGAAVHSVRAVDPASIRTVAAYAADEGVPLHAHVSEQPRENDQCLAAFGDTPVGVLHREGALRPEFTAVHATHLTARDITLLGESRSTVCMCPTTERDLADGIGPSTALLRAGCRLSLGTDSHAIIDPFEEARAVELNERLACGVRGVHSAPRLLQALSSDGYASLGWNNGGRLAVDAPADFVTVGLQSVRTAGWTAGSLLDTAVFAGTSSDVVHVVVNGKVVVADGKHVRIDVPQQLATSIGALAG